MIESFLAAQVFDLAQPLESSLPIQQSNIPFKMAMVRRHGDAEWPPGRMSAALEIFTTGTHTGTHIDALSHISHNGALHGDVSAEEVQRGGSLSALGVETIEPFLYHGVLLDIPAVRRCERLDPGDAVTATDMETARAAQGVETTPGCAVLVRTGWGDRELYRSDAYFRTPPGPDPSGAAWLIERAVSLTGSDTFMYEQATPTDITTPVHKALLVDAGVYIAESLYLDELAHAKAYEFGLVIAPLPLVGASGSPIRPLALVW